MLINIPNNTKQLFESRYNLLFIFFLFLFFSISISFFNSQTTHAAFNAGNIISDAKFTDYNSMNASQIQQFLNSKNSVCLKDTNKKYQSLVDDNGDGVVADSTTEKYGRHAPMTAAQLINAAAKIYKINPQVILVTLQKEQGLITRTDCPAWRYNTALGYGCPDSAPCDNSAFGFTRQIDYGTYHFRGYFNDSLTYVPFSTGNHRIYYNPNQSCGSSIVNIQNRATASLYSYTPYQPNAGALAAGYGEAPCGAYGNRNFYLFFTAWFGSGQISDLVRTTQNATVYLISDNMKYPISSSNMMSALSRFGPVSYVPQSYIDGKTTGVSANRAVKSSSSSTIYFIASNIKLPFSSCSIVEDYDLSCASPMILSTGQIGSFANGPNMTNLYKTTDNEDYYVKDGIRRQVFDQASLQAAGISGTYNRLGFPGVSPLPGGQPIIREGVIAKSSGTGMSYLHTNNEFVFIPNDLTSSKTFTRLSSGKLSGDSLNAKTIDRSFVGFAKNSTNNSYVIDANGKSAVSSPGEWTATYKTLGDNILSQSPNSTQPINSMFIKSNSNASIYRILNKKKHPINSWDDFIKLHADKSTSMSTLSASTVDSINTGAIIVAPGSLIKSSNSAAVYVVNDVFQKSPLTTFNVSNDLGLGPVRSLSPANLNSYTTSSNATTFVRCNSKNYVANRGLLYEVTSQISARYGWDGVQYKAWGSLGCGNLKYSQNSLPNFIKASGSNTIFYVDSGQKKPISSMQKYQELGGNSSNTLITSPYFTGLIATGNTL